MRLRSKNENESEDGVVEHSKVQIPKMTAKSKNGRQNSINLLISVCCIGAVSSSGGVTVQTSKKFSIFCFSRATNIYIRFICKQT